MQGKCSNNAKLFYQLLLQFNQIRIKVISQFKIKYFNSPKPIKPCHYLGQTICTTPVGQAVLLAFRHHRDDYVRRLWFSMLASSYRMCIFSTALDFLQHLPGKPKNLFFLTIPRDPRQFFEIHNLSAYLTAKKICGEKSSLTQEIICLISQPFFAILVRKKSCQVTWCAKSLRAVEAPLCFECAWINASFLSLGLWVSEFSANGTFKL